MRARREVTERGSELSSPQLLRYHRRGRLGRRCQPWLEGLEERTLLASPAGNVLAGIAIPIALGAPTTGTLAAGDTIFYQVSPTAQGKLTAQVQAGGAAMRLSLLNGQGQVLTQSDGQSLANPNALIDVDVPAGPEYLEVENLGNTSAYTVTATLLPASAPFQTLPLSTVTAPYTLVAGDFTGNGNTDLALADTGANEVSVLLGNGDGTFAPQVTYPVGSVPIAIAAGDFTGNGQTDLAVANQSDGDVSVLLGEGNGTFAPQVTYAVGLYPYSIVAGDFTGDGRTDLAVVNAGDSNVSVLLGNGDGTFHTAYSVDQSVELAVLPNGSPTPDFIYADQALDQVVVDYAGGQSQTVADRTSGLLAPGAVVLADLNGDGIPDLIVANSGGNNVLVYPGLGNGQFGPELNGGHGYFTGTNPVSITVANLNGRPDLVVTNEGSNDVSILLNVATADGGFTFVPGPRLQAGLGPTSTLVAQFPGNAYPDLLVSDGGSNDVRLLPGVGFGFFIDSGPQVETFPLPAGSDPVQVMAGSFLPNQGPEILTVNRGANDVTVISDFLSSNPVFDSFSTGGIEPVAALGVAVAGEELESLVVANEGDGLFTLLGGAQGLDEEEAFSDRALPAPTALALASLSSDEVSFYATTAGTEAAFTLAFLLPGFAPAAGPVPGSSSATALAPPQLVALGPGALALVESLLVTGPDTELNTVLTVLNTPPNSPLAPAPGTENPAEVNTSFLSVPPSQGQSLFTPLNTSASPESEAGLTAPATPVPQATSVPPWVQSVLGVDEMIQEIRRENRDAPPVQDEPVPPGESPLMEHGSSLHKTCPISPAERDTVVAPPDEGKPLRSLGPRGAAERRSGDREGGAREVDRMTVAALPSWVRALICFSMAVHATLFGQPRKRGSETIRDVGV